LNHPTGQRDHLRPAKFDRHVPTFNIAGFVQTFVKGRHWFRSAETENADYQHRQLLRPRSERPRRRRAAQQRDELAPSKPIEWHPLTLARVAA